MNGRVDFRWVWLDLVDASPTLSGNAHHVAYTLARKYVNRRTLEGFPSQATLARTMHRGKRQTGEALHELVEKSFLDVRRGHPARGQGLVYTLRAPNPDRSAAELSAGASRR
jgi:hypothetical protein